MERRVAFTLDRAQIEQACEQFIAQRLLPDEIAQATVMTPSASSDDIRCVVEVEKKRIRKPKKNGGPA
jgi:hypothetical protein